MTATSLSRGVGLAAAVLLGVALGYDLGWHLLDGRWLPTARLIAGLFGITAMLLAVTMRHDPGPRWPLRAILLLCSIVLAADIGATFLHDLDARTTAAMMGTELVGTAFEWGTAALLALAVLALAGSWPRARSRAGSTESGAAD